MTTGQLLLLNDPDFLEAAQPMPARYLQISTVVVQILREYFGQTEARWLPGAAHLRWAGPQIETAQEAETSGLEIYRLGDDRGDINNLLPKLIVRRNAMGCRQSGIGGSRLMGSGNRPTDQEPVGRLIRHQFFGAVLIYALSRQEGEADFLAADTHQLLAHYSELIRKSLCLTRLFPSQVGELGTLEEFPGYFAVPIVVDYIYDDTVELISNNFPIRRIKLELDT